MTNTASQPRPRASAFARLTLVLCVVLGALDVLLVQRNRALSGDVARLSSIVEAGQRPALVEGERFPRIAAFDAGGAAVDLVRSDEHVATLLLVSSDGCGACEGARPTWRELAELCRGSHVRVLELVVDGTRESLAGREAPYALAHGSGDAWALTGRMPGIPAALLIDGQAVVLRAFYGERQEGLREAVEAVLVDPPGPERG